MQLMAPLDVGVVGGGGFSLRREEFPHRPRRTVSCALLPLLLQRGGCQSVRDVTVMILLLRTVYVHVSYSCTRVGTSRRVSSGAFCQKRVESPFRFTRAGALTIGSTKLGLFVAAQSATAPQHTSYYVFNGTWG